MWPALAGLGALLLAGTAAQLAVAAPTDQNNAAAPAAETKSPQALMGPGDAAVTAFPGTRVLPVEGRRRTPAIERTFIDTDAPSLRVFALGSPGFLWDARLWQAPLRLAVPARKVGLVFGLALDDAEVPNIYATATSAFGLHLVGEDRNGDDVPDRLRRGASGARWMPGQWGDHPQAGPGSVYRIDGRTGEVTLLATITVDGRPIGPAALGNIAFDPVHQQLFVSDRDTGRIHRLAMNGTVLESFDHGTSGHEAAGLAPLPAEPASEVDITDPAFDARNPETWGLADSRRRTWGLAVHGGRLYYAVARGARTGRPEVWSVGLDPETGAFLKDARFELALPEDAPDDEISDIAFTRNGAMLVAQRGAQRNSRDYRTFARTGESRVYRFWREVPDDPATEGRWRAPEEHAVGFRPDHRNTNGGIALGYGYTPEGTINPRLCSGSLWSTGEALRLHPSRELRERLKASGFLPVIGFQGVPARPARPANTPPWRSYVVDMDGKVAAADEARRGHMGDIEIFTPGCGVRPRAIADLPAGTLPEGPYTPWNYPDGDPWTYPPDQPPSCTWETGCTEDPGWPEEPADPGLKVQKACDLAVKDEETGKFVAKCRITVIGNGNPPTAPIVISESLGGSGTIVSWSATDPWMCGPVPPVSAGTPLACTLLPQDFVAANHSSTTTVTVAFGSVEALDKAENCASLTGVGEGEDTRACSPFVAIAVEKEVVTEREHCSFGTPCSYTIKVTNLSSTRPYNGPVVITDQMTGGTMIITSITPSCTPTPTRTPFACTANVNLPPGGSQTFTVTGMLVPPAYGGGKIQVRNCAGSGSPPTDMTGEWWQDYLKEETGGQDCVTRSVCAFSCHMEDVSNLEIEKTLKDGDCRPGTQCTFTITIRNTGTADRPGPFSIVDTLPNGAIFVSVSPMPWTCAPSSLHPGNAIVCKYPPLPSPPVPAGGSLSFDVTIAIPPDHEGEEIKNCAAFDLPPGKLQARLTRLLGVTDLAGDQALKRLSRYLRMRGMEPEKVRREAADILAALQSLPAAALNLDPRKMKSCVTVPLPQEEKKAPRKAETPKPPVVPVTRPPVKKAQPERPRKKKATAPACDRRTTVRRGNRCVCRFGGARKVSATRCACPRGTRLNPKRGRCEKVRKRIVCRKPAFPNRQGTACLCPRGWEPDGRRGCRKVVQEPPRIRCLPPAFPVREGRACACPRGWRKMTPFSCIPVIPDDDDDHPRGDGPRQPH